MAAPIDTLDEELVSSKLGTKAHWDQCYERELGNFRDCGDVGEVWFGYESVERVVDWLENSLDSTVALDHSILDLGCGNGVMLIELHKAGFTDLTGVDYSQAAVDLARLVAKDEARDREITFQTGDILEDSPSSACLQKSYNICIDKGTYDAISLNPDNAAEQRARYLAGVRRLLLPAGMIILTSCNWTREELLRDFEQDFVMVDQIETPSFQFGGKTGSKETCLILVKKEGLTT